MNHQVFRRVHMLAVLTGAAAIMLPGGSGDNVQYMPAAMADSLAAAEEADKGLKPEERQKQFYKNGIRAIDPEDYYEHNVDTVGGAAVEYRQDKPQPAAAKPQANDPDVLGAAIGKALVFAMQQGQQPSQPTEPEKPADNEPQQDAKLAQETKDAKVGDLPLTTTVNNVAAVNSEAGATNPVQDLTQDGAGTATDAGNDAADKDGKPEDGPSTGATTAQVTPPAADAATVPSGRPKGARTSSAAAAKAAAEKEANNS